MPLPPDSDAGTPFSAPPSDNPDPLGSEKADQPPESAAGTTAIRIHYADLHPEDITEIDGIPVTTPTRTLLDLATVSDDRELRCALAESLRRRLTDRSEILAVIARYPHHLGGSRLRALLETRPPQPPR